MGRARAKSTAGDDDASTDDDDAPSPSMVTNVRMTTALAAEDVREVLTHARARATADEDEDASAWCTYATAERFLRADKGDVKAAKKRLCATLKWRAQVKPERSRCTTCFGASARSHYMQHVGFDRLGRALVYSDIGLALDRRPWSNVEHCVQVLELLEKFLPPYPNDQYLWVCDFHKFGVSHMNPSVAYKCLSLFARSYPERLEMMVFVEAPKIFNGLYKTLTAFVDPMTVQKLRFVKGPDGKGGGEPLDSVLREHLNDETMDWLVTEMRMNRMMWSVVSKHKSWIEPMIRGNGIMPAAAATEFANHDNRGTKEFIASEAGKHAASFVRKHAEQCGLQLIEGYCAPALGAPISSPAPAVSSPAPVSVAVPPNSFSFAKVNEALDDLREFDRFE